MRSLVIQEKLPAGQYWIGDPCYFISKEDWDDFLDATVFKSEDAGVYEYKGHRLFTHSTAWGDGRYFGTDGRIYGVDSGMLSAIPVELALREDSPGWKERLGTLVTFKDDTLVGYEDGLFFFGSLEIDTDGNELEPEEDYLDDVWFD